jgi:hypothetical protein
MNYPIIPLTQVVEQAVEFERLIPLGKGGYRPPFPAYVDSTMVKTMRACMRKFELEYLHHWKSKSPSIHLHAGAAFASALEEVRRSYWENKLSPEDSLLRGVKVLIMKYGTFDEPHDTAKTLDRMIGALEFYFERWPLDKDEVKPWKWGENKYAIEFSFASALPFRHPVTGEPVTYTGRSDFIGEMSHGLYIVDDKTTSSLGAQWLHQWDLRSQFTGYVWAARDVASIPVQGAMVRGVSILKTKYDTAEVITYRPDWQVKRWLTQTVQDLQHLQEAWESGYFDFNLDEECNSYGGCLFRRVCLSNEPDAWLKNDYEKRVWDPLTREERPLLVDGNFE